MTEISTQVAIIGGGPAGLLLSRLLKIRGIESVILERRSAEYVRARVRAGVLEPPTVGILEEAGVADRLHAEGLKMAGIHFMWDDVNTRIDFGLVDSESTVYGQTKITRDLMNVREEDGTPVYYEAEDVTPHNVASDRPFVTFTHNGEPYALKCDFVAGCDGAHGVSRGSIPKEELRYYDESFPFAWLAMLTDARPVSDEVVWVNHVDGFVMCSLRSPTRSRYYIQVPATAKLEDWSADSFWAEFERRLPESLKGNLQTGAPLEMSVTPLRSTVIEPMRHGRLFLAGDSAHVVPPIGAKGLNLAIADAHDLANVLGEYYASRDEKALARYSEVALQRVWRAVRFSWWMANLMHRFSGAPSERPLQLAELNYIRDSKAAQLVIAENFCGVTPK